MSDKLNSLSSWFSNDRITTEYLYGIKACYFANMKYRYVLNGKIEWAKALKSNIIANELQQANTEPETGEEYSEYQKLEMRLNAIEKAIEFNEFLLKELKDCKD